MAITDAKQVENVLLSDEFLVEINGYPGTFVCKCDLPKSSNEAVKIRGAGMERPIYLAGTQEIDTIKLEVYMPAEGPERLFWENWHAQNQTHDPKQYWRDVTFTALGPSQNPKLSYDVQDAWVQEIGRPKFNTEDKSKPIVHEITMRCNNCVPRER